MIDGLVGLRLQLAIDLLQLAIELRDLRIRRTELGAQVSNLNFEIRLLLAQFVQQTGGCSGLRLPRFRK